jgi:hypothetical protein
MNVLNIGSPDKVTHQIGSTSYLGQYYGLDSQNTFNKIKNFVKN